MQMRFGLFVSLITKDFFQLKNVYYSLLILNHNLKLKSERGFRKLINVI